MLKKILILFIFMILSVSAINMALAGDPLDPIDTFRDPDGDGLLNWEESENGSDPNNADSDNDGLDDKWEVLSGLNPVDPTDAHKDFDYIEPQFRFNGEIDAEFNAIITRFDVWPSDKTTKFAEDKHYDNYEEYYRISEWVKDENTGKLVKADEPYSARTDPFVPDTDGDEKLDPDDAAPTLFDTDGAVFSDSPGITRPGTIAHNQKLQAVNTIESIHGNDAVLAGIPVFAPM